MGYPEKKGAIPVPPRVVSVPSQPDPMAEPAEPPFTHSEACHMRNDMSLDHSQCKCECHGYGAPREKPGSELPTTPAPGPAPMVMGRYQCNSTECRIETFKGVAMMPLNYCPVCCKMGAKIG